jgi:hypothetical protein
MLLGVRGKPRMYRSLLAYCTARFWTFQSPALRDAPAPADAFRTPAVEAGTFQPPLRGVPTPTDALRTLAAEAGTTMSGNRPVNFAKECRFPRTFLGTFTCRKSVTWDPRLYFPSERKACLRIFLLFKNPTASAGFEPANLGTRGQHANP